MVGLMGRAPWWEQPLAAFDTETTGVDVEEARLVTAHLDGQDWLIDPGVEIPQSAIDIHGVTTERAQEEGEPMWAALTQIHGLLVGLADRGVPVVAMNAAYDFTVLDRAFRRNDHDTSAEEGFLRIPHGLMVVDPYVLDKHVDPYRKGGRKLVDMCRTYGVTLNDAHDATADARAAVEVARVIGRRFAETGRIPPDPFALHTLQVQWRWEQCESLESYFRRTDPTVVVDPWWPVKPSWTVGA